MDCSITIKANGQDVSYQEVDGNNSASVEGKIAVDPIILLTIQRLNYWIREDIVRSSVMEKLPLCDSEDLRLLGTHLYRLLFANDSIRARFEAAVLRVSREAKRTPDRKLRLNIIFENPADKLATLPWEFLYVTMGGSLDRGVFVAGERTELLLSRQLVLEPIDGRGELDSLSPDEARANGSRVPDDVLKILLIECNPDEIDGVQLPQVDTEEFDKVRTSLATIGQSVQLETVPDPSFAELLEKVERVKPRIVHYIGHGRPGHIALRKVKGEPDYDRSIGDPQYRWVNSQSVRVLFGDVKPRLVFLNACSTGASESIESFKSLARELLFAGVGGVVAMQYGITNGDAAAFAQSFYEAIALGAPIDEAAKVGRKRLGLLVPPWSHPRFATPIVYVQDNEPVVRQSSPPIESDGSAQRTPGARQGPDPSGGLTA